MDPEYREKVEDIVNKTEPDGRVRVYAEIAETQPEEIESEKMQALALAYARYLSEQGLRPGDATFAEAEDLEAAIGKSDDFAPDQAGTGKGRADMLVRNYGRKPDAEEIRAAARRLGVVSGRSRRVSGVMELHDRIQDKLDSAAVETGKEFLRAIHRILSTYRQSRRTIGIAVLIIGIVAMGIMMLFDKYTVYEYAYNGKVLGYVNNQEDVTDVLEVAGTMLTENNGGREIVFTANQNVTFSTIDARGKSIDDADAAVNKLVYMTDIETEAYGIYEGKRLIAAVKSEREAENVMMQARTALSKPDKGMEVVSSEYIKNMEIRPINILLTSIQSSNYAVRLMTEGGTLEVYHIVEQNEDIKSLARTFGAGTKNIYDESGRNRVVQPEIGDTVCIRREVKPVRVRMTETGRMKEIIEYETIKKESADYYKGDVVTEQEGVNGVQIFEGTVTKISGEVTKRDTDNIEVITKKQDKILLIGTAERPKTAPTGTYIVPLEHYEGITSPFGYRWGRLHSGIDMGAHHGEPIHATDGGTIQRAGWYYGYGLCVEIDHGNGRMTRYGHCSAILVNVGDKVYQGQEIALVGNTGHSFGNHLHFEVNFNGSPVDPRPYLGI